MRRFFWLCVCVVLLGGLASVLPGRAVRGVMEQTLGGLLSVAGVERQVYKGTGRPITYWSAGAEGREAVVLLHGAGGDALSSWFLLMPELAEQYSVYALQLKFGDLANADSSLVNFFWEQNALLELLEAEQLEKVTLVGLSAGSWVAALFAANYPDKVTRLVMLSPMGTKNELVLDPLLQAEDAGREFAEKIFHSPPPLLPLFSKALGVEVDRAVTALRKFYAPKMLAQMDIARRQTVRVPVLLVWGDHDRVVPREVPEALLQTMPDAKLLVLSDAGHAVVWDARERVCEAVMDFLKK